MLSRENIQVPDTVCDDFTLHFCFMKSFYFVKNKTKRTFFYYLITVCTPIGFIRLFGIVGQVLVKPNLSRDTNEDFQVFNLEEASVIRKIANNKGFLGIYVFIWLQSDY